MAAPRRCHPDEFVSTWFYRGHLKGENDDKPMPQIFSFLMEPRTGCWLQSSAESRAKSQRRWLRTQSLLAAMTSRQTQLGFLSDLSWIHKVSGPDFSILRNSKKSFGTPWADLPRLCGCCWTDAGRRRQSQQGTLTACQLKLMHLLAGWMIRVTPMIRLFQPVIGVSYSHNRGT